MRLNKLKIRNFRCFRDYEIEFAPQVTVLFGKNGTGKTTLIHAIHKALSFIMHSERVRGKDAKTGKMKVIGTNTVTEGNSYLRVEGFSKRGDWFTTSDPLIEITAEAQLPGTLSLDLSTPLMWSISAFTNKSVTRKGEFIEAFRNFYNWYTYTGELPLLCYISDSFPHKEDTHKRNKKKKISGYRSYGYFNWNDESGNTKEWVGRLENAMREIDRTERRIKKLEEREYDAESGGKYYLPDAIVKVPLGEQIRAEKESWRKLIREVQVIERILCHFANNLVVNGKLYMEVSAIGLHPDDDKLCLRLANGEPKSFRNLPAGYKRLFSIVLDIAYRSLLLNPEREWNPIGIAMIDEIDLHLHPELEKVCLNALMQTFPHLQLIVSTHSPAVLSGLQTSTGENKVLRMSIGDEAPTTMPDVYGLDYNSVVQEIMSVGASNPELQHLISRCAYLYKNGYIEQGDALRKKIIQRGMLNEVELTRRIENAKAELK